MEQVFTMLGYPSTLISDNGTQITSNYFELYLQIHNIKHQLPSLYWPQANVEFERFNKTITKTIKCARTKGRDWNEALQQFLLMYRTTPHTTTGISRAQNLFHHIPNSGLPTIKPNKTTTVNNRVASYREQNREYIDKKRFTQRKDFQIGVFRYNRTNRWLLNSWSESAKYPWTDIYYCTSEGCFVESEHAFVNRYGIIKGQFKMPRETISQNFLLILLIRLFFTQYRSKESREKSYGQISRFLSWFFNLENSTPWKWLVKSSLHDHNTAVFIVVIILTGSYFQVTASTK